MSLQIEYTLNPHSGRYIVVGGTLHRRLIREGKMPSMTFKSRTPSKSAKQTIVKKQNTIEKKNTIEKQEVYNKPSKSNNYNPLNNQKKTNKDSINIPVNVKNIPVNFNNKEMFYKFLSENINDEDFRNEFVNELKKF